MEREADKRQRAVTKGRNRKSAREREGTEERKRDGDRENKKSGEIQRKGWTGQQQQLRGIDVTGRTSGVMS
jgi:hypothetical protein